MKILSYLRELSVVIVGVLITLAITQYLHTINKEKELNETLSLVKAELENNLKNMNGATQQFSKDMKLISLLQNNLNDLRAVPTEEIYNNSGVLGSELHFSPKKDAYDVLKSSALMQYMKDKKLLLELMTAYSDLDEISNFMEEYTEIKQKAFYGIKMEAEIRSRLYRGLNEENDPYPYFEALLQWNDMRNFLSHALSFRNQTNNLIKTGKELEELINRIEEYK